MPVDDLFLLGRAPGLARALTRGELMRIFEFIQAHNLHETLFYDGSVCRAGEFADLLQDAGTWFYAVCGKESEPLHGPSCSNLPGPSYGRLRGHNVLAIFWLNNFSGRGAMIHFCVLPQGQSRAVNIGRFVTRFLLFSGRSKAASRELLTAEGTLAAQTLSQATDSADQYCLDALYGLTPAPFRHALSFVKALGFQEKGRLPHALSLQRNGKERTVDGVITCLTRQDLIRGAQSEAAEVRLWPKTMEKSGWAVQAR